MNLVLAIKYSIIMFSLSTSGTLVSIESNEVYPGMIECYKGLAAYGFTPEDIKRDNIVLIECFPTLRTFELLGQQ